jgi:hypothetical protein
MKRGLLIQFLLLFAAVLIGYALVFGWIERRRVTKGPWEVTFSVEADRAQLIFNQTNLNIRDVRLVFVGVVAPSNMVERITFTKARATPYPVPFGQCVFQDLVFLPGTVTLEMFGHEIQLLPRVLTIDKVERSWRSGETIELPTATTNSPSARSNKSS